MKKIRDFFSSGEFLTSLQKTIEKLSKKTKKNGKAIVQLGNNDNLLAQQITFLKQENTDLRKRLDSLEEKIWSINIGNNQDMSKLATGTDPKLLDKNNKNA